MFKSTTTLRRWISNPTTPSTFPSRPPTFQPSQSLPTQPSWRTPSIRIGSQTPISILSTSNPPFLRNHQGGSSISFRNYSTKSLPQDAEESSSQGPSRHQLKREQLQEMRERRIWLEDFKRLQLRREDFDITFSRSSGPGGQNVNKLNTKANLKLDLSKNLLANDKILPENFPISHPKSWLTRGLVARIVKSSTYYTPSSHSIQITSGRNRSQDSNVQDCLEKLKEHLIQIESHGLVGETSDEQRRRVGRLVAIQEKRRKDLKLKRGDVKSGRRFKG